jgi:hypothetical protein
VINCFVIIVNFHSHFEKPLTDIFQFCRALRVDIGQISSAQNVGVIEQRIFFNPVSRRLLDWCTNVGEIDPSEQKVIEREETLLRFGAFNTLKKNRIKFKFKCYITYYYSWFRIKIKLATSVAKNILVKANVFKFHYVFEK